MTTDITTILSRIDSGDPRAAEELLPLVYDELRKLAAIRISREKPGQTLEATALVHEAYLRLVDQESDQQWDSRSHFFAAAAEAMRRILIDRARSKQSLKHGGDHQRMDFEIHCPASKETPERLLAIDEALSKLQQEHPQVAELLTLRYFAGVPMKDAAELLGISPATAKRRWAFARAYLYGELTD
ncbi:ECF-type sigma factor [Novipirellula artificiosorum]|uniref:RNA polymerase sigma factor SigL n=1 Tax=Novipirellula artificiosorum TaxID=2528016 RepID=A0A5C6CYU8_9BACT|nr:ECF-type sigma factor [Novipirellula artificiosorum]TWU28774.1 RNA polymerase sigma factor SigL [Novipirellula artificiosorum]